MGKHEIAKLHNGATREQLIARLPIPGPGRPKETQEQKVMKRAIKDLISEYKENLAQYLPDIEPVIVNKAKQGDLGAIKEIHDRVMGKPLQKIGGDDDSPLIIQVTSVVAKRFGIHATDTQTGTSD